FPPPIPPRSTLFPYTTLFRSLEQGHAIDGTLLGRRFRHREPLLDREYGRGRPIPGVVLGDERAALLHAELAHAAIDRQHAGGMRSEEHTSELQSRSDLVCRLL